MMYCTKCGKDIPPGSSFCNSCGTPVTGQNGKGPGRLPPWGSTLSLLIRLDPALAIIPLGSFFLILGAFLPWDTSFRASALGVQFPAGAVILALGVLFLVALVLSRTGTPGSWGLVLLLVSALALALIFQTIYHLRDAEHSIGAGVYIALVGALVTTIAGAMEFARGARK